MKSDFSERIKTFREQTELSQGAFAERADIEQVTVSQMERGRSKPTLETASKILKGFPNLNPDWLMSGTGAMLRDDTQSPRLPAEPTHAPAVVAESQELKEVKQDRDKWREMALGLMEELRQRPQRQALATGTDGASFPSGNQDAAEPKTPLMSVSYRQEDLAA